MALLMWCVEEMLFEFVLDICIYNFNKKTHVHTNILSYADCLITFYTTLLFNYTVFWNFYNIISVIILVNICQPFIYR